MVKRCSFALTVLLAWVWPAHALTLIEAYDSALQNDPTYRAAIKESESGQLNREIGKSSLLPVISYSYSNSKNSAVRTSPDALGRDVSQDSNYRSVASTLSLRQQLINYESMAKYRQGQAQGDYSEALLKSRRQELAVRLAAAYTDVLFAQDQLQLALAQSQTLLEQKKLNERALQAGEGTRTDVLETQSKYDVAQVQVIETRNEIDNTRRVLEGVLGRPLAPGETLQVAADVFRGGPLMPERIEAWTDLAQGNNAELAAQRHAVAAARQEAAKNRAGHMPRVELVGSISQSRADTVATFNQSSNVNSLGIQLNIPIYAGGYVQASTSQAALNVQRLEAELDSKTDKVMAEVRKQFNLVRSSASRIEALTRAENSAQELILATRKSVQGGVRVNLDVVTAQQQLYVVRRDLAQAKYASLNAWLKLRFAAGVLADEDMQKTTSDFLSPTGSPPRPERIDQKDAPPRDGRMKLRMTTTLPVRPIGNS